MSVYQILLNHLPPKRRANCLAILLLIFQLSWGGHFLMEGNIVRVYWCLVAVLMTITWLLFYNWNWIVRNWWFRKGDLAFKLLIPELEKVLQFCVHVGLKEFDKIDLGNDFLKVQSLSIQLTNMNIGLSNKDLINTYHNPEKRLEIWHQHFAQTLEYAKNGKYKEYVKFLEEKNARFLKDLEARGEKALD